MSEKVNQFYTSKTYSLLNRYYETIKEFAKDVYELELTELMAKHYEEMWTKMSDKYESVNDAIDEYYNAVLEHPHIALANDLANHGYQKVSFGMEVENLDNMTRMLVCLDRLHGPTDSGVLTKV